MKEGKKSSVVSQWKGAVVGKSEGTLSVSVAQYKEHTKYRKKYRSHKKYAVHNPDNKYEIGDSVEFVAARPMSKRKRFRVL